MLLHVSHHTDDFPHLHFLRKMLSNRVHIPEILRCERPADYRDSAALRRVPIPDTAAIMKAAPATPATSRPAEVTLRITACSFP